MLVVKLQTTEQNTNIDEKVMTELINANPVVYNVPTEDSFNYSLEYTDEDERELFTPEEIFHYIRKLNDPEHPLTLEQLNVVNLEQVHTELSPGATGRTGATLTGVATLADARLRWKAGFPPFFVDPARWHRCCFGLWRYHRQWTRRRSHL